MPLNSEPGIKILILNEILEIREFNTANKKDDVD